MIIMRNNFNVEGWKRPGKKLKGGRKGGKNCINKGIQRIKKSSIWIIKPKNLTIYTPKIIKMEKDEVKQGGERETSFLAYQK